LRTKSENNHKNRAVFPFCFSLPGFLPASEAAFFADFFWYNQKYSNPDLCRYNQMSTNAFYMYLQRENKSIHKSVSGNISADTGSVEQIQSEMRRTFLFTMWHFRLNTRVLSVVFSKVFNFSLADNFLSTLL